MAYLKGAEKANGLEYSGLWRGVYPMDMVYPMSRGLPRTGFVDHGQTWNFILKSVRSFGMFGEKEG